MHTGLTRLARWIREESELRSSEAEIDHLRRTYDPRIKAVTRPPWNERQALLAELFFELEFPESAIERIRTDRAIRRCRRYAIPIPDKPREGEENQDWNYSQIAGHLLTDRAHQRLRQEIAVERKMIREPVLAWIAIAISAFSLVVAIIS
ncbi:MAG: hypothetical protein ABL307_00940 [Roseitalea porphyridii]|uniref:hypothetical protein n=1 Tax=Roseitalea porphyridii TaxID=1852022 RepID=UPI0032D9704B